MGQPGRLIIEFSLSLAPPTILLYSNPRGLSFTPGHLRLRRGSEESRDNRVRNPGLSRCPRRDFRYARPTASRRGNVPECLELVA